MAKRRLVSLPVVLNYVNGKFKYYFGMFKQNLHLKFRLANLVSGLLPEFASGAIRAKLYRVAGFKNVEADAFIIGNLQLTSGQASFYQNLIIGSGAVIGDHVTINLDAEVRLGKNVSLGPLVIIYTGTHQIGPGSNRRVGQLLAKSVKIEDGCWIGLAAIILPGVTVGRGSIVAAGAVVTQDVAPNSFVEGNPAKLIQSLPWGNR